LDNEIHVLSFRDYFLLYRMSYIWYTGLAVITVIIIGSIVSLITGTSIIQTIICWQYTSIRMTIRSAAHQKLDIIWFKWCYLASSTSIFHVLVKVCTECYEISIVRLALCNIWHAQFHRSIGKQHLDTPLISPKTTWNINIQVNLAVRPLLNTVHRKLFRGKWKMPCLKKQSTQ
jgi:hypothetical protein